VVQYEIRTVAYIDILGFTNLINKSPNDANTFLKIMDSLRDMEDIKNNSRDYEFDQGTIDVSLFSDNILISSCDSSGRAAEFNCLISAMYLQMSLLGKGILTRGGVTKGQLFHNSNLLFGPALVKAHDIESQISIFPRIVVDETITSEGSIFKTDFDGYRYLDTLGQGLFYHGLKQTHGGTYNLYHTIYSFVKSELQTHNNVKVREKLEWLRNYCEETFALQNGEVLFHNGIS